MDVFNEIFSNFETYPEQSVKCNRCLKSHGLNEFLINNCRYKLCIKCRNYNKKYLKSIEPGKCLRCRKKKKIEEFWNNNRRYKYCNECRNYNKKYLKTK